MATVTDPAAVIGMPLDEIDTPSLIVELDAFERNVAVMKRFAEAHGVRLRAHAKTHKSADIARYQIEHGGACGVCCQKVSEAEALVASGVTDILVSNEVVSPRKIARLARLAAKARIIVCVDAESNIGSLAAAALSHGVILECLVEIDVGAGRCGVPPGAPALRLAQAIATAPSLKFSGLQAYQGSAQHIYEFAERRAAIDAAVRDTANTVELLKSAGLQCGIVGGAGTGTYKLEGRSGIYNELQCGSYIFMDADYGRVRDESGRCMGDFENSLFVYASIMSKATSGKAICDAGLKALSVDSGMPVVYGRPDLAYVKCSDEHGVISDPNDGLRLNDRLMLVPGHCDPTVNLYDRYVCIRKGRVEAIWPITARGMAW